MCSSGGHLLSLPGWLATVCFSMLRYSTYFVYSFIQSHRVSKEKANSFQIDPNNAGPYISESIATGNNNPGPRCICTVYTVLQFNYVFISFSTLGQHDVLHTAQTLWCPSLRNVTLQAYILPKTSK